MRKLLAGIAVLAATATSAQPASALAFASPGVSGGITVYPDFTACATLTFHSGAPFAGEFAAVGTLQGPSTRAGTVRGALPIADSGTWYGCIPGAYYGATVGDGKFTLSASSLTDDYVEVLQCVVNFGVVTCF